ncbi:MAG: transglutaminase domain-containing protein [Candidatus Coatesbacteria bacterium]|nr:transglutaminase domain-containing protein [Candidatus Coatesbacteria bacterium]
MIKRIALLLVLLIVSSCQKKKEPAKEIISLIPWESYYIMKLQGKILGYNFTKFEKTDQSGKTIYKTTTQTEMGIIRLGIKLSIKYFHVIEEDENLNPLSFKLKYSMATNEIEMEGKVKTDTLYLTQLSEGQKTEKSIFIGKVKNEKDKQVYFQIPLQYLFLKNPPKTGDEYELKIFMPILNQVQNDKIKIEGIDTITVEDKKTEAFRLYGSIPMMSEGETKIWVDKKGMILASKTEVAGMTIDMEKVSKEFALSQETGGELDLNIYVQPTGKTIANPRKVADLTVRLSIPSGKIKQYISTDELNKITKEDGENSVIMNIKSDMKKIPDKETEINEVDLKPSLEPTVYVQSNDSEIKKLAQEIAGNETNKWKIALKLAEWVNKNLGKNYLTGFATAKEVFKTKQGDCTEHTVLHIALCRSLNIPARAASGLMYERGRFAYHMWSEVYYDGWKPIDSTWPLQNKQNRVFVDATHLKLAASNLDDNLPLDLGQKLIALIGKLQIEIIDYK